MLQRGEVKEWVIQALREVVTVPLASERGTSLDAPLSEDTLLADLGVDSLGLVQLYMEIETQSGGKVKLDPDSEIASFDLTDSLKTVIDTTMRCALSQT
jgi:acyl carrier protein